VFIWLSATRSNTRRQHIHGKRRRRQIHGSTRRDWRPSACSMRHSMQQDLTSCLALAHRALLARACLSAGGRARGEARGARHDGVPALGAQREQQLPAGVVGVDRRPAVHEEEQQRLHPRVQRLQRVRSRALCRPQADAAEGARRPLLRSEGAALLGRLRAGADRQQAARGCALMLACARDRLACLTSSAPPPVSAARATASPMLARSGASTAGSSARRSPRPAGNASRSVASTCGAQGQRVRA